MCLVMAIVVKWNVRPTLKLRKLYGAVAERWGRAYVRERMRELTPKMLTLSPEQMEACLVALDLTVQRRTGRPAADFLGLST